MEYGIEMYGVRDISERSLEEAVRKMAELGYDSVEFAGFYNNSADEINKMLKDNNIKLISTHSNLEDLLDDYEGTLKFHKQIGNKHYILSGYDLSTQEKLDEFISKVNPMTEKLKAEGITMSYHNHAREFILNEDGSCIFEQLLYRTELKFQIDTYWAWVGMKNPIKLLERLKDRIVSIHLKDGFQNGDCKPLGMGNAPLEEIRAKAAELNIPVIVESETLNPDGYTESEICMEYLKKVN